MECEAMSDTILVLMAIILYGSVIYLIETKILKRDPWKDPWEGDI
jgi:hypothetical protein